MQWKLVLLTQNVINTTFICAETANSYFELDLAYTYFTTKVKFHFLYNFKGSYCTIVRKVTIEAFLMPQSLCLILNSFGREKKIPSLVGILMTFCFKLLISFLIPTRTY